MSSQQLARQIEYAKGLDGTHIMINDFLFYNSHIKLMTKEQVNDCIEKARKNNYMPVFFVNDALVNENSVLAFSLKKNVKRGAKTDEVEDIDVIQVIKFNETITKDMIEKTCAIIESDNRDKMLIGYPITLEEYCILKMVRTRGRNTEKAILLKTKEDVVNHIILNFDSLQIEEMSKDVIDYLFDTNYTPIKYKAYSRRNSADDLLLIERVFERRINGKNYRVGVCREVDYGYYPGDYRGLKIRIVEDTDPTYNYYDNMRIMFTKPKDIFFDLECIKYEDDVERVYDEKLNRSKDVRTSVVTFNMDAFKAIQRDLETILPRESVLITSRMFNFYNEQTINRYGRDRQDKLRNDIDKKLLELLKDGREVKIYECLVSKNFIKLPEHNFCLEFDEDFLDFESINIYDLRNALNIANAEYNFNTIYNNILRLSSLKIIDRGNTQREEYKNFKKKKFIINGMKITVARENDRIYINDSFVRIDDWYDILSKAICYTNVADFNHYIEDVSHIGCTYKHLIANGVSIDLYNPFHSIFKQSGGFSDKIIIRFSLLWDIKNRSKIYLKINDMKCLIRNKVKFRKDFNYPHITMTLTDLHRKLEESLGEIDTETFVALVDNAIEEGKVIKERGEHLVKVTIEETGAEVTTIEIGGRKMKGYLVVGNKSGSKYFILNEGLDVYKYTNGQWNRRCVVDYSDKQRIYEDRLANRLVNIRNEPSYITTIHN